MPVLTCPFTTIPAQTIFAASTRYPAKFLVATELSIKPTATETWGIEGISLVFTTKYEAIYAINVKSAREYIEKSITFLKASQKFLEEQVPFRNEQLKFSEQQAENLFKVYEKEVNERNAAAAEAAFAERESIKAEIKSLKHEIEAVKHEITSAEKELSEVGVSAAREGVKNPPLIIQAKVYARGNELVWNSELSPLRFSTPLGIVRESGTTEVGLSWQESVNEHTQFNDPIDFTERENLRLVLEFSTPPELKIIEGGKEGPETGDITLSQVQAIVNYSRQVAQ
jgi:hypothetical protein